MDRFDEEFEQFLEQLKNEMENLRKAVADMETKYKDCENFSQTVAKSKNWGLTDAEKKDEQKLLKEFDCAINKWKEADKKFKDFIEKSH